MYFFIYTGLIRSFPLCDAYLCLFCQKGCLRLKARVYDIATVRIRLKLPHSVWGAKPHPMSKLNSQSV